MNMDGQTGVWLLAVLLSAALHSAEAQNQPSYFAVGGKLLLRPDPVYTHISNIMWKHNGNLVAEWKEGFVDLKYYGTFRGHTSLNSVTGELEIRNISKDDSGLYTVEINNQIQRYGYNAFVIQKVPRPEVIVTPGSCSQTSIRCLLSCDGNIEEAGPVTFYWKVGIEKWEEGDKYMTIINNEEMQTVTLVSCRMKNPVSERESEPLVNPFFQHTSSVLMTTVCSAFGFLLFCAIVVCLVERIRNLLCCFK